MLSIAARLPICFVFLIIGLHLVCVDSCLPQPGSGGCCRRGCCEESCCQPPPTQIQTPCASCSQDNFGPYEPPAALPAYQPPPMLPQQSILAPPGYQAQPPPPYNNNPPAYQPPGYDNSMAYPFVQEPTQHSQESGHLLAIEMEMEKPPPTLPPALPLGSTECSTPPCVQHQVAPSSEHEQASMVFMHEGPPSIIEMPPSTPPTNPPANPHDLSNGSPLHSQPNNVDINSLPNTMSHGTGDDYDGPKSNITPEQRAYSIDDATVHTTSTVATTHITEGYNEDQHVDTASSSSYSDVEHSGYRHSSSSSFYNTYNDQVCTGESFFRTREKSLLKALRKCAALGCAAANVEKIPLGVNVDFLRSVDKRMNNRKKHCISRFDVPLFSNNMLQIEKELHIENTDSDSEPSVSLLRRRPPHSIIFRPQKARFVTTEPKSSY